LKGKRVLNTYQNNEGKVIDILDCGHEVPSRGFHTTKGRECKECEGKVEGYWRKTKYEQSDLPYPEPYNDEWGKGEFIEKLKLLQGKAQLTLYRGMSSCRLCGCMNGSGEYSIDGWRFPSGYLHYIEVHDVKPSEAFIAYVKGDK
jgi:hypothetical protein